MDSSTDRKYTMPGSETFSEIQERLEALRLEHRDLDAQIAALAGNPAIDQLQLSRMKRRKLRLKDMIARLESRLIPDIDA